MALVERPKFGEVRTPEGGPGLVRLKALVMLANRLRLALDEPLSGPRKKALDMLNAVLR